MMARARGLFRFDAAFGQHAVHVRPQTCELGGALFTVAASRDDAGVGFADQRGHADHVTAASAGRALVDSA